MRIAWNNLKKDKNKEKLIKRTNKKSLILVK